MMIVEGIRSGLPPQSSASVRPENGSAGGGGAGRSHSSGYGSSGNGAASDPGGTGTGLHVCRRLVEAHGGRIWIEPDAGRSAISFSVPVARRAHVSGGETR